MSDLNLVNVTGNSNEDLRRFVEEVPEGLVEKRHILCEIHPPPEDRDVYEKKIKEITKRDQNKLLSVYRSVVVCVNIQWCNGGVTFFCGY